jgi:hypothetical protein
VVTHPQDEPLQVIERVLLTQNITDDESDDRANVKALAIEELRRLYEGVLVRYGLKPSALLAWKQKW